VPFVRSPGSRTNAGVFVAADVLSGSGWHTAIELADPSAPHLVFDWAPDGNVDTIGENVARLAARVTGGVEVAVCAHPGGPPTCWCRPPLPGLLLAFARAHGVDTARSTVIGTAPAHRTLANAIGARYHAV
jgi:hypothetical protein